MTLSNYADENGLPIMDQLSFERMTNEIGKEQFRLDLAEYIEKNRPKFPLKKISLDDVRNSFYDLQKLEIVSIIPEVVELYWPGPLTIVVETNKEFADGVGTKNPSSIGVRVPDNELAIELLKITGPLAVTSANLSGENNINSDTEAENVFGNKVTEYLEGESLHGSGSTIIDLRVDGGEILREGPLKWPPSYC